MAVAKDQAPKFFSSALFRRREKVKISYQEAAEKQAISRRTAINRFARDIEAGYIAKRKTYYKCAHHRALLGGKNIYFLTGKGKAFCCPSAHFSAPAKPKAQAIPKNLPPETSTQTIRAVRTFFNAPSCSKRQAFDDLLSRCPRWWTENISLLKKTLRLLFQKLKIGYRVRSIPRWISSVLKQLGVGFSRRQAARLSSHVPNKTLISPATSNPISPYMQEFHARLGMLTKKGVRLETNDLLLLLRNGSEHLDRAAKAYLKIEKTKPIQNPNAFLSWLVSLEDPLALFNPKQTTPSELVEWTKAKLNQIRFRCEFLGYGEEPAKTDSNKVYVYFAMHKTDPERSFLYVTWFERGLYSLWQETRLSLSDPEFRKNFLEIFQPEGDSHGNTHKTQVQTTPPTQKRATNSADAA